MGGWREEGVIVRVVCHRGFHGAELKRVLAREGKVRGSVYDQGLKWEPCQNLGGAGSSCKSKK